MPGTNFLSGRERRDTGLSLSVLAYGYEGYQDSLLARAPTCPSCSLFGTTDCRLVLAVIPGVCLAACLSLIRPHQFILRANFPATARNSSIKNSSPIHQRWDIMLGVEPTILSIPGVICPLTS